MSITEDTYLPEEEELTVQEVNLSSAALKSAAHHLGNACLWENNEFMLCRKENDKDPRKCIEEGKAVTSCTLNFFKQVKKNCAEEFTQYVHCMDKSSSFRWFQSCRKTQGVFDKCMLDNLNMERPPYDQYARVQVHKTDRPKPPAEPITVYPDAVVYLPEDTETPPPAKYGSRFHWIW